MPNGLHRRRVVAAAASACALACVGAALAGEAPGTLVAPDLPWASLSPPGWRPQALLDRLGVEQLDDKDPRSTAILAEVQREWQKAPPVKAVPAARVRMTGFAVMLDDGQAPVRQILLVPYYGACIHSPPPPANQVVLVTLDSDLPRTMYQFPVWITGTLQIKPATTRHGRALYRMDDASWERYPWPRRPMPIYRLPG
jgi:uncharacterized protein